MAWETIDQSFPTGEILIDGMPVSIEEFKNNNFRIIKYGSQDSARNMIIKNKTYAWGDKGEFAIGLDYDLMNIRPHATAESPTNVYGMAMLYNFIQSNNLERFLNNLNSFQPQRFGF